MVANPQMIPPPTNSTADWLIFGAIIAFLALAAWAGSELDAIAAEARSREITRRALGISRQKQQNHQNPPQKRVLLTCEDILDLKKGSQRDPKSGGNSHRAK
jgi:hypothetical protein